MLRRLTGLLLVLSVAALLTSCSSKKKTEQPVTVGFSCDVNVEYEDMNVKGHLTRSTAGTLSFDVKEPSTLNGLTMQWNGDTITIKLHGLSFNVDPDTIPQSALGKRILGVLDAALGIREEGKLTEEGLLTRGSSSVGEFEIVSDPKNGNLLLLRIPSANLKATFSNFTLTSIPASATAS